MSVWDDKKSPLAPQYGEQRFLRPARIVLHGNEARAVEFIPLARTLLGQLVQQDYILGGLPQSSRWVRMIDPNTAVPLTEGPSEGACSIPGSSAGGIDGSSVSRSTPPASLTTMGITAHIAYLHGQPLIEIWARSRAGQGRRGRVTSPLLWLPEGILITPRHASIAPDGWGLPDTLDNRGTPGGPLRDVLLNRLPGNAYPDRLFQQIAEDLGAQDCMTWRLAPVFFLDSEEEDIGIHRPQGTVDPQVGPRYEQLIREEPVAQWFCHRPQLVRYIRADEEALPDRMSLRSELYAGILDGTNAVRAAVGRGPLMPAVRGRYTGMAQAVLREVTASGIMLHDSEQFRVGYKTFVERAARFGQVVTAVGENLAIVPPETVGEGQALSNVMVQAWVDSPPHYANMIFDWLGEDAPPQDPPLGAFLETAVTSGAITEPGESSGNIGSQVFVRTQKWVEAGLRVWEGDVGRVSIRLSANRYQPAGAVGVRDSVAVDNDTAAARVRLFYRGHILLVPATLGVDARAQGLGACLLRVDDVMFVRIAYVTLPEQLAVAPQFVIEDWRLEDIPTTEWALAPEEASPVNQYVQEMPTTVAAINVLFSPSGRKATIAVYEQETLPNTQFIRHDQEDFNTRATVPATGLWRAASLRHLSFNDGWFSWGGKQEVFVEPVDISTNENGWNQYHVTCAGTYEAYRDFVGEVEVAATVEVDWEIRQKEFGAGATETDLYAKANTKIVFPNASEFVCVDSSMEEDYTAQTGFATVIRYLDIRHPEKIVYTRHDLGNTINPSPQQWLPTMSQRLFIGAEEVSSTGNVMPRIEDFSLPYYGGPDKTPVRARDLVTPQPTRGGLTLVGFSLLSERFCYHPYIPSSGLVAGGEDAYGIASGDVCAATHHASLLPPSLMRVASAGPAATSQNLPCIFGVAPCFSAGFSFGPFDNTFDAQRAEHDGEYVAAVELGSILGMEKYGLQGEDRFFYRSSLDLEAITGVEGLSKNILPIGAL